MIAFPTWILTTICSFFMVAPVALTTFCKGEKGNKINKIASIIGFTLYAGLVSLLTMTESSVNFYKTVINFTASSEWLSKVFTMSIYNNSFHTFENLAMLMPLGAMTTQNQKAKGKGLSILKSLGVGLIASGAIEAMQFILPVNRVPDVCDIMMNTLSCGFGATAAVAAVALKEKIFDYAKSRKNKNIGSEESLSLDKGKAFEPEHSFNQKNAINLQSSGVEYTISINPNAFISQENTPEFKKSFELSGKLQSQYSSKAEPQSAKISKPQIVKTKDNDLKYVFDLENDELKTNKEEKKKILKKLKALKLLKPLNNPLLMQMSILDKKCSYSASFDEKTR